MTNRIKAVRFQLGQTVATPGALEACLSAGQTPWEFIQRHQQGDWGYVCKEDRDANNQALRDGTRLLSAYQTSKGVRIWVALVTEAGLDAGGFVGKRQR